MGSFLEQRSENGQERWTVLKTIIMYKITVLNIHKITVLNGTFKKLTKKAKHYHMVIRGVGTQSFVYFRSVNKVKTIRNLKIFNFLLNIRNMQ